MRVEELMTRPAVAVPLTMPLRGVADVLAKHRISGVPVVDRDGVVVGVVSESDIVRRESEPEGEHRGRLARAFGRRRVTAPATTAGDLMGTPPIVAEPGLSAYGAAWLMSTHDVNRLPVVASGTLVGVISRADLVRYFARSDEDIARDVREELELLFLADVDVAVEDGCVHVAGDVDSERDLVCLPRVLSRVPGVIGVELDVRLRGAVA